MKTKIFTILLLAIPFLVSAQNFTITSGASVTIEPGGSMIAATFDNEGGSSSLIIKSDATGQGTFIFDAAGTNGADATVEIYTPIATTDQHWHFVSPPVTNATARDFYYDANHDAWLYQYIEGNGAEAGWKPTIDLDSALSIGSGYSYIWQQNVSRENDNGTVTFTGPLGVGDISMPLTYTGGGNPDSHFNLVGNPYTATIDIRPGTSGGNPGVTFGIGVEQSYWIWSRDDGNYHYGSYVQTYPGNILSLDGHVAMGQSFFLKTKINTATWDFQTAMRDSTTTTTFWKKSNADENYASHIMLLASKGSNKDKLVVTFADNGTEDFEDGYDITKLFGGATSPQLYLNVQDRKQSINYIASLTETEERTVPFSFRAGEDGEQTFEFTTQYLIDATVLLEDTKTGIKVDLMKTPVYTFTATTEDNEDRFLLHFKGSPTGIENPEAEEQLVGIYSWDKTVYISNKDNSFTQTSTITIHDMYGRLVYSKEAVLGATTKIPVQANNTYLVVRVKNVNGIYTNKVFIK